VKRLALAALAALLVGAFPAAGEPASDRPLNASLIEEAVASYGRALDTADRDPRLEEFRRAERLFARAAENAPGNPALYTNLGNAALQAEHLGTAVLAYRRALAIDPDHPRAVQNLEHARSLLPEWVPKPTHHGLIDTFFVWHQTLARSDRALGGAGAFALAALLVACAIRFRQPPLRTAAIVPALVWLALLASLIVESSSGAADAAVVTADEAVARAADSALAPSALPAPLPGGTEVRILEARSPWLRVRLANGRDAWVAESALTPVTGSN
jgi:tetratricopeptide (TPR) repeat protein